MATVKETIKETSLFVKSVMAKLAGDDASAKALKIARKCMAFSSQYGAALEAERINAEIAIEEAEQLVSDAYFPTEDPQEVNTYMEGVVTAHENLERAKKALEDIDNTIKIVEELKKKF